MELVGYGWEHYEVQTEDDWIITIFRIKGKLESEQTVADDKLPLLFMSGAGGNGSNFVAPGGQIFKLID